MDTIQLKKDLMRDEGFRGKPYLDTEGKTTIGYGRNLDANPLDREEGEYLLERDIKRALLECDAFPWFHKLTYSRKCAVGNMMYQLGLTRFSGFRMMIEAEKQALDSKWARQCPDRAHRVSVLLRDG